MATSIKISRNLKSSGAVFTEYCINDVTGLCESNSNLYEVTGDVSESVRVYGDIDMYVDTHGEALAFDKRIQESLRDVLQEVPICLMTASGKNTLNSKGAWKVSWRFVLPTLAGSKTTVQRFIRCEINPKLKVALDMTENVCDMSVYDNNRKMRMVHSSKDGETRPLKLVEGTLLDSLITYIPEDCEVLLPPEDVGKIHPEEESDPVAPEPSTPRSTLAPIPIVLSSKISDERWEELVKLAGLIPDSKIASYIDCCKFIWIFWNQEQSVRMATLIDDTCKRANYGGRDWVDSKILQTTNANLALSTIKYWCGIKYSVKDKDVSYTEELFTCSIDANVIYSARFVRPLCDAIIDHRTVVLKSNLGTGKTVAVMGSTVLNTPGILNLYSSDDSRVLFISARKSFTSFAMNECDIEGFDFTSYESKTNLSGYNKLFIQIESLWKLEMDFTAYDLVVMDESESILKQLYSKETHKDKLVKNHVMLEKIVLSASKCILMDAFISERTIGFATILRGVPHYIENTYQPYNRTALRLVNGRQKDVRMPEEGQWIDMLKKSILEKKRVAVIWGSKSKGLKFQEWLVAENIKAIFYHSESDNEVKATLKNVNETWASVQVLMYTSAITVGISYTALPSFDILYLYGCAGSACPRDIAQALLRCRTIADNKLVYTCDTRCQTGFETGTVQIENELDAKRKDNTTDHPLMNWIAAPLWVVKNHTYNMNEERISKSEYNTVLNRYLVLSGYTITDVRVEDEFDVIGKIELPVYSEIALISASTSEDIKRSMTAGEASPEEVQQYMKFKYLLQIKGGSENPKAEEIFNLYMLKITEQGRFWNLVKEKHTTLTQDASHESKRVYSEMTSGCLALRGTMEGICKVLGIENSQDAKEIKITPDIVKALEPFKDSMRTRGATEVFEAKQAFNLVKTTWTNWCGSTIVNGGKKERCGGGKSAMTFVIKTEALMLWGHIVSRNDGTEATKKQEENVFVTRYGFSE